MAYRPKEQARIDQGLCKNCGHPRTTAKVYCPTCIAKAKVYIEARRKRLRASGLCEDCGGVTEGNRVHCESCLEKQRASRTKWKQEVPRGFCTRCKKRHCLPALIDAKLYQRSCQECYLRHLSSAQLGSSKHWKLLLAKLTAQDYRCVYSGDEIVLGLNDSVDHIRPKSKYPELANDPDNIQWVTRTINRMKDCLDHGEFISLIRRVIDRCG